MHKQCRWSRFPVGKRKKNGKKCVWVGFCSQFLSVRKMERLGFPEASFTGSGSCDGKISDKHPSFSQDETSLPTRTACTSFPCVVHLARST